MWRSSGWVSILLLGLTAAAVPVATAEKPTIVCVANLRQAAPGVYCPDPAPTVRFSAGVSPKKLDRQAKDPVQLNLAGRHGWNADAPAPALREVAFAFDRNGGIEGLGAEACRRRQLVTRGTTAARRICHDSIVGTGSAHLAVPESIDDPSAAPLTLFYGGAANGTTTVFVHTRVTAPLVVTAKLREIRAGRFGLEAVIRIPASALAGAELVDFSITTARLVGGAGSKQPFALAKCSDGRLSASMTSRFADGTRLTGAVVRSCTPR